MTSFRSLLASLPVVVSLCACASSAPEAPSAAAPAAVRCEQETRTGSNIIGKRCRSDEQIEDARRDADELLRAGRAAPTGAP